MTACLCAEWRERAEAAEARADEYRVEADRAARDYDALEVAASQALEALNVTLGYLTLKNARPRVREAVAVLHKALADARSEPRLRDIEMERP